MRRRLLLARRRYPRRLLGKEPWLPVSRHVSASSAYATGRVENNPGRQKCTPRWRITKMMGESVSDHLSCPWLYKVTFWGGGGEMLGHANQGCSER